MEKRIRKDSASQWEKWVWCCEVLWQTIFSCVTVLAILWSCARLIRQLLPELSVSASVFVFVGILSAGSKVWNLVSSHCFQKKWIRHVGNFLILAVIGGWLFRLYLDEAEAFWQGTWYVGNLLAEQMNRYLGTAYAVTGGVKDVAFLFLNLVLKMLFLVLITIAAERRRDVWVTLPPAVAIIYGLCVGMGPDLAGMAVWLVCLILHLSDWWTKDKRIGRESLLAGTLVISLVIAVLTCSVGADWVAAQKEDMLPVQKKLEQKVAQLFAGAADVQNGKITSRYPNYTEEEMLRIHVNEAQTEVLYLRGTYADTYENGKWTREKPFLMKAESFSDYEDCQGLDPLSAVADESSRKYLDCLETGVSLVGYGLPERLYDMEYTGLKSDIVYLPYGPETDTLTGGCTIEGDYQFRKKREMQNIGLIALGGSADALMENIMLSDLYYPNLRQTFSKYDSFYKAYNKYVKENYLDVPDNLESVRQKADALLKDTGSEETLEYLDDPEMGNAARLSMAYSVASMLEQSYAYEKDVPDPDGMDPVEFFLNEGNGGFCIHFASAGVLLLREFGVPARYVSGYKVDASEFVADTEDPDYGYVCSVPDSDAHAWVEIYLDDYGWVPVEMTPSEETSEQMKKLRGENDTDSQEKQVPQGEETGGEQGQNTGETQNMQADRSDSENTGSLPGNLSDAAQGQKPSVETQFNRKAVKNVLITVTVAIAVLCVAVIWQRRRKLRWEQELKRALSKGHYRRAANMLNRQMYRWLVRHKKITKKQMRDAEYAKVLQKLYPDLNWKKYLRIIRKAVYSGAELTEEEYLIIEEFHKKVVNCGAVQKNS